MLNRFVGRLIGLSAFAALIALGACATPPADPEARAEFEADNDPIEPVNRAIFDFNLVVDGAVIKPAAQVYRDVLPERARNGIHNALQNLRSPIVFANDVLQGETQRAAITAWRFVINSTIGILGIFDVAKEAGYPPHSEDFGQTFAKWGIGEGPYLVLPILGPSNPRDATGLATEWVTDPFNLWMANTDRDWVIWTRAGLTGIDYRSSNIETIDEIKKTSIDFYAAIRSLYRQRRAQQIQDTNPTAEPPSPTPMGMAPEASPAASLTESAKAEPAAQ
jgi:phospholipid-binding lipoprotein MlaA